jgi:hypothetical protein
MKKFVVLLGALAGVALLAAQTTPQKAVEKEEPPIPGIVVQRPGGNQLGVTINDGTFKISFYDKKRKPMAADVTRARVRWNPSYKVGPEQTILSLTDDGKALSGGKIVRAPYVFKLYLTLLKADEDDQQAVEHYVVNVTSDIVPKT